MNSTLAPSNSVPSYRLIFIGVLFSLALLMATADGAAAANIVVNSLADTQANDGACTLREAIINANNDNQSGSTDCAAGSGADTITFSVAGTITLGSSLPGIGSQVGSDITIDGGSVITISGGNSVQVFNVGRGPGNLVDLCISNSLTLQELVVKDGSSDNGGGIFNRCRLVIADSMFSGNSASNGGGAIYNADLGSLTIVNSTFYNNSAPNLPTAVGGVIVNEGGMAVSKSTFFANSGDVIINGVDLTPGGLVVSNSTFLGNSGRAIFTSAFSTTGVNNSTFYGNRINSNGGFLGIANSILANSTGSNCFNLFGGISDGGNNIDDGTSCGFSAANNSKPNTDPLLDPAGLNNNGGPTKTVALCTGVNTPSFGCTGLSPAIDAGAGCSDVDQRGFLRPADGDSNGTAICDIGAFESGAPPPPVITASPSTVPQGNFLTVTWDGVPFPQPKDWIGLYMPGSPNSAYLAWLYVSCVTTAGTVGKAAGFCNLFIPYNLANGVYELRFLANDGFRAIGVSDPVTVGGAPLPPPPGATISANPTTVSRGSSANVNWSGVVNPTAKDWIGLYVPGSSNSAYKAWVYTSSCQTTAGAVAKASGVCSPYIGTNLPAANYEFRLLANDGFNVLAISAPVIVQ